MNGIISPKIKRLPFVAAATRVSYSSSLWSLEQCFWTTQAPAWWILIMPDSEYNQFFKMVSALNHTSMFCFFPPQLKVGVNVQLHVRIWGAEWCSMHCALVFKITGKPLWMHFITPGDTEALYKPKQAVYVIAHPQTLHWRHSRQLLCIWLSDALKDQNN